MARDDDLTALESLADRMQLDEKETDNFINEGMKRLGYRPRMDWDDPEPDDGGGSTSSMFGGGSQRRSRNIDQRDRGRGSQRDSGSGGRRASGGMFGYDN